METKKRYTASVIVTLRKNIDDAQGKTIESALHTLGFLQIRNVRAGKVFRFQVEADSEEQAYRIVEKACEKLLANPVIEDYEIVLKDSSQEKAQMSI